MNTWHYAPAHGLQQPLTERLRSFPRQPDMLLNGMQLFASLTMRGWLHLYHRLSVVGRENLPAQESFVMIANHASHLDALCLLASLPLAKVHHAFPAAAEDYFFVNARRAAFAVVAVNALPFDRKKHPMHSLNVCRDLLESPGNVLILFPEGTRSDSGALGDFKAGVGFMVAGTNCPVVPCHLDGTHAAWRKGCWFPRPRHITVRIGEPHRYPHLEPGRASAQQIAHDLRDAVQALAAETE
jgi:1-acyl-sn-glycerol-3-phosphate acyltransferase